MSETNRQKPWPLYFIVGMVALVLVLGFLLSPRSEESRLAWIKFLGTTNKGLLLNPPTEVMPGQIIDAEGQPWVALEDNTWKLLLLSPNGCAADCVSRLQEMHAMRIRLNRDADRLTIGLLTNRGITTEPIADDVHQLYLLDDSLLANLQNTNLHELGDGPVVLLMNPIDVVMMIYGQEHTGVDILEDFEHLLDLAH